MAAIRLLFRGGSRCSQSLSKQLLAPVAATQTQTAGIVSKLMRGPGYSRPPPFDYKETEYVAPYFFLDNSTWRFDENSKVIVVDGAIGSGKTELAKELADQLDMLYVPEANMDMKYINRYGGDLRIFDPHIDESIRTYDVKDFLKNPRIEKAGRLQWELHILRLTLYMDGLLHLLSTGQGVVMDRSIYTDIVFMNTFHRLGYISKDLFKVYKKRRAMVLQFLLRPHLIVYLDLPAGVVEQRVKARGRPEEQNSPVYTKKFFKMFDEEYKAYLNDIESHSKLLFYDWTTPTPSEEVVEDIELIDFDNHFDQDPKLKDWRILHEDGYNKRREWYTGSRRHARVLKYVTEKDPDAPELDDHPQDIYDLEQLMKNHPAFEYAEGYNINYGDYPAIKAANFTPPESKFYVVTLPS